MNHSRYYDEDKPNRKPIPSRAALDRQFWLIILESWSFDEIEVMEQFAESHEKATRWS